MINIDEIIEKIEKIPAPEKGYRFIIIDNVYFGKSKDNYYSFARTVDNKSCLPIIQNTKYLDLFINCTFEIDTSIEKNISVVTLKSNDKRLIETFIRLAISIIPEITDQKFHDYFMTLKEIFSNSKEKSEIELQGLYAELYILKYIMDNLKIDLSEFYQSQEKMKFDYSVSENKKIEIKSTTKAERIHHFRQEQLNVMMYDIIIFSLMLRKDDQGLSLYDLIQYCKTNFAHNFKFISYLEKFIYRTNISDLKDIKYNENYTRSNLRIIKADNIPKVEQEQTGGVFNIEFDSNLEKCDFADLEIFKQWLKKEL